MSAADVEVFRGRGSTVEAAGPTAFQRATLQEQFQIATSIANAVEAVPRGYRKQPGAVLLALAWAQQHELDILTTIQNVSFIEGRAVVDATMQRALAKRAGYDLTITVAADSATVGVHQDGRRLGEASFSVGDAEAAELSGKKNWRQHREDMLVARATTRAIRRYAPDVLLGMTVSDEVDDPPEPAQVDLSGVLPPPFAAEHGTDPSTPVVVPGGPEPEGGAAAADSVGRHADQQPPAGPESSTAPADVPPPVGAAPWASLDEMRADLKARRITTPDAVNEANALAGRQGVEAPAGSLRAIYDYPDPVYLDAFAAWVESHAVVP